MTKRGRAFNSKIFLSTSGTGRKMMSFSKGQTIYAQGDRADSMFVIQTGKVKLRVKQAGREATLDLLTDEDMVGEDSIAGESFRMASASTMTECRVLRISKKTMTLALKRQVKLANIFWAYVLARNIRYQKDLVDQHCNRSEKRLARILWRLSHHDGDGRAEATIPILFQATLAEMVGTTRSRVSFFMSRFKRSGFIDYDRKAKLLRVHRSLLALCGPNSVPSD